MDKMLSWSVKWHWLDGLKCTVYCNAENMDIVYEYHKTIAYFISTVTILNLKYRLHK